MTLLRPGGKPRISLAPRPLTNPLVGAAVVIRHGYGVMARCRARGKSFSPFPMRSACPWCTGPAQARGPQGNAGADISGREIHPAVLPGRIAGNAVLACRVAACAGGQDRSTWRSVPAISASW
jgi:hypothetical protein